VNDLLVILSREKTVGRVRVTVAEERVRLDLQKSVEWEGLEVWSVFR